MAQRASARIRELVWFSMQNIIVAKPYQFIPPFHGDWIPWLVQKLHLVDHYLKHFEGVESHEVRGAEHLRESLDRRHGVLLTPNHCRYADPIAMGWIARELDFYIYSMASWHLFHQNRWQALAIRLCGGFSVYREGLDRQALNTAVDMLSTAKRPLVIFPEGTVFRTNDRLQTLLDGVAFLARTAAKRRLRQDGGKVVIHPVAIKYLFRGDVQQAIEPVLLRLEKRLTLNYVGSPPPLLERLSRLLQAQLSLQEVKYLGSPQSGPLGERQQRLIQHLLVPLEQQWFGRQVDESIMPRVKQLRTVIVPRLLKEETTAAEKQALWSQLADIYMAQQISSHPSDYLDQPTDTRMLETIESIEEDLTDRTQKQRPLHAILEVGPAIEVEPQRPTREGPDPLMTELSNQLSGMLAKLAGEARPWHA